MHQISYFTYDFKTEKSKVQAELDAICRRNSDNGNSLPAPIKWVERRTFESYERAQDYIEDTLDEDVFYGQFAVPYYDYTGLKESKALISAKEKLAAMRGKYRQLANKVHYADVKSAYISCKRCGSKIATSYVGKTYKNMCPVCGEDMRPFTVLSKLQKMQEEIEKFEETLEKLEDDEHKKMQAKAKVRWLVKIEYHT